MANEQYVTALDRNGERELTDEGRATLIVAADTKASLEWDARVDESPVAERWNSSTDLESVCATLDFASLKQFEHEMSDATIAEACEIYSRAASAEWDRLRGV